MTRMAGTKSMTKPIAGEWMIPGLDGFDLRARAAPAASTGAATTLWNFRAWPTTSFGISGQWSWRKPMLLSQFRPTNTLEDQTGATPTSRVSSDLALSGVDRFELEVARVLVEPALLRPLGEDGCSRRSPRSGSPGAP